jgi:Helix-turn-helix domain
MQSKHKSSKYARTGKQNFLLDEYLTPAELAEQLNVCLLTLHRWGAEGRGPPRTKIGRKTYYSRSSVIAWLRGREQKTQTAIGAERQEVQPAA